jgi:hypothetical protein
LRLLNRPSGGVLRGLTGLIGSLTRGFLRLTRFLPSGLLALLGGFTRSILRLLLGSLLLVLPFGPLPLLLWLAFLRYRSAPEVPYRPRRWYKKRRGHNGPGRCALWVYLRRSFRSPLLSFARPVRCSKRPSDFLSLSPVRAPAASFIRPLALSIRFGLLCCFSRL